MDKISEVAARWAVRANAGLSPDEASKLEAWLNLDTRHRGAYVRARAVWVNLDRLSALNGPLGSPDQFPVVFEATVSGTSAHLTRRQVLAAGFSAIAIGGGAASWLLLRDERERYTSGIGEVRRIALADGSTVLLNTHTEIAVKLTVSRRSIELFRGEALFDVSHDADRPFIVRAKGTAVRAVGTAFAVRLNGSQLAVTVTEGVVEVSESSDRGADSHVPEPPTPTGRRVKAHERAVVTGNAGPQISPITEDAAERQLAWRNGLVSFSGESLADAVDEINRHNRRQIVIDDPALALQPVMGVFRATDIDAFSAAAAASLKARVVSQGNMIRLKPAAFGVAY